MRGAIAVAFLLASISPANAETPVYPKCESGTCVAVNYERLLLIQKSGADIRGLSPDELKLKVNSEGAPINVPEVIGGIAFPPLFEEVVRIEITHSNGTGLCTGIALGSDAVLTAAHCGCSEPSSYRVLFQRPIREVQRESRYYPARTVDRKPSIFYGYDCSRTLEAQPGKDLALLFLTPSASPGPSIVPPPVMPMFIPQKLASDGELKALLILGYGRREDDKFPHGLIGASAHLRDSFCLIDRFDAAGCSIFREFTLSRMTSDGEGADTCDGDSGGPVYMVWDRDLGDLKVQRHRVLLGITSRAMGSVVQYGPTGCGGGGVYTSVGHPEVVKWLALQGVPVEVAPRARRFAERAFQVDTLADE
ncbi:trypsin-like serine protease [Ensifer adhaerens]|uniref:trypsin-like serine protease n=1 Tax=Ensifer adhaerens TaxID=106592 RepID=UPI00384FCCCC